MNRKSIKGKSNSYIHNITQAIIRQIYGTYMAHILHNQAYIHISDIYNVKCQTMAKPI